MVFRRLGVEALDGGARDLDALRLGLGGILCRGVHLVDDERPEHERTHGAEHADADDDLHQLAEASGSQGSTARVDVVRTNLVHEHQHEQFGVRLYCKQSAGHPGQCDLTEVSSANAHKKRVYQRHK